MFRSGTVPHNFLCSQKADKKLFNAEKRQYLGATAERASGGGNNSMGKFYRIERDEFSKHDFHRNIWVS